MIGSPARNAKIIHSKNHRLIAAGLVLILFSTLACNLPFSFYFCGLNLGLWQAFSREGCPVDSGDLENEGINSLESASADNDSINSDLAACLPNPSNYSLEITNLRDGTTDTKRSCNARGSITNLGDQELMFAVYWINHQGAEENFGEKWLGAGYSILAPGVTAEYGRFHRCTGGLCGEGEWHYIQHLSILYNTPVCSEFAFGTDGKPPESFVQIDNPCDW